jgi:hypothetical protein
MADFLRSHKCNALCAALGLPDDTAALDDTAAQVTSEVTPSYARATAAVVCMSAR